MNVSFILNQKKYNSIKHLKEYLFQKSQVSIQPTKIDRIVLQFLPKPSG